jgi:hypothetical protein
MNVDYEFVRGDGDSITIEWKGKDFTNHTIFFTAKKTPDNNLTDSSAIIQVTVPSTDLNGVEDEAVIPLSAVKLNVAPGVYNYDVQIKNGSADPQTIRIGKIKVVPDITRRTS